MLTNEYPVDYNNFCMAGKIRTKEVCPKCEKSFEGNPLRCPACLTTPKKYFIDLYQKNYGRLKIYSDKTGHPLDSFARAQRVLEAIRYEIDQHIFDPSHYISSDIREYLFETRVDVWYKSKLKEAEKGNLAESYTTQIKRYMNQFYLPYFKGKDIRDIKTYHIQQFYESLPSEISLKYTKNIMNALENFFNMLRRFDYLKEKPAFPVITLDRKTPRWIDRATQFEALKKTSSLYKPIFTFLMFQGVRPGEAMALKVKDIELNNEILFISRTFSANRMRERVKSKVVRPRAINPILIDMLKELCKDKHPEAFVFLNSRGRHFTDSNLRIAWHKVREALRVDVTLYQATRHSWATNALKDGADLKSIGDILGHTDIRTTLKYAHSEIDNQRAVFKKQHGAVLDIVPRLSPSVKQA